jgi:hypothetical protein
MQITMMKPSNDDLLSLRQAAQELGVNRMWLSGWLANSRIRLYPLGKSKGIKRRDLPRIELPPRKEA